MSLKRLAIISIFCCSIPSFAQKNEVSLSIGAMHSSDQTITLVGITCPINVNCSPATTSPSTGVALEGNYARELISFGAGSLDVELPLVGVPGRDVKTVQSGIIVPPSLSYWTLFLTPSARIKLHAGPISPFVSVGGGWAHFGTSVSIAISNLLMPTVKPPFSFSTSTNNGALQFGGGADFKTPLPHLALRAEVRDFWAQGIVQPANQVQVSPQRQHNIFAAGGVVLKF